MTSSWSSSGTGSSTRATSAARASDGDATCCSRRPRRSTPTTSRSATSPARRRARAAHRARSASCAPMPRPARRAADLRADALRHQRRDLEAGARGRRRAGAPNGGIAIDTWHLGKMHSRPTSCVPSRAVHDLGRAVGRHVREHARPRSTRTTTAGACRARVSSPSPATSPSAATSATTARGASRCCPTRSGSCPWRRCSSGPSTRPLDQIEKGLEP